MGIKKLTQALKKLTLERTDWFSYKKKPVREGWYECSFCSKEMHYWNGKNWYANRVALEKNTAMIVSKDEAWSWRGLTHEAHIDSFNRLSRLAAQKLAKLA